MSRRSALGESSSELGEASLFQSQSSDVVESDSDNSLGEEDSSDFEFKSAKKLKPDNLRSRLDKELEKTSADVDDDSGTEDSETERLPGMFADLLPLEGTNSVRCRYCIKLLINEKQILDHVRSRRHKKKYRQAKLAGMSKAALEHRQTRENARKKKRLEKRFAHKEADKREKGSVKERLLKIRKRNPSDLTEEQIRKRKEKFQRKKTRRLERSQV